MRVIIYHNIARDNTGRPVHFDGYERGHPLVPVFAYDGAPDKSSLAIAEEAFMAFNADPEQLPDRLATLAVSYRARSLRSLSLGDVVKVGDVALACRPVGFAVVPGTLNQVSQSEHGTRPYDD